MSLDVWEFHQWMTVNLLLLLHHHHLRDVLACARVLWVSGYVRACSDGAPFYLSLSFSRALVFQSVIILCLSVLTWRDLWELVKIQTWVPNLHRIPNEIPTRSAKRIMFKMYYFTSKMCGERWGGDHHHHLGKNNLQFLFHEPFTGTHSSSASERCD